MTRFKGSVSLLLLGFITACTSYPQYLVVEGYEWHRSIDVEAYGPIVESAWELPEGATDVTSVSKVHHQEDDYCYGMYTTWDLEIKFGRHKCKKDVKQDWFSYTIVKWHFARTERSGGANHEAAWPEVKLAENEREGRKSETYKVRFSNPKLDRVVEQEVGYDRWASLELGRAYQAGISLGGHIQHVGDLVRPEEEGK